MLIEVETFALVDGADREEFLAADRKFQAAISSCPGFLRRTTAEGESGWIVISLWGDDEARANANRRLSADGSDPRAELRPFVDTVETRRYTDIGG